VVAQLDARLLEVADARAPAERVWLALQEPVELQPRAWLRVAPGSIEAGPITGDQDRLHTTLTLTGHPFVQIGPRPRVVPKPLPSLGVAPGGEGGFHVVLDAELPVREASALLDRSLRGRTFRVGIRPMKVLDASVFVRGPDTGVALDVQFHAGLFRRPRGLLTVLGTLRYDPATRALWLDQPRLSLESKALLRLAAVEMFGGTIDRLVQEKARFPIGDKIDRLRRQLAEALNRQLAPIARLETRVDSLRAVGVYTRGDALVGRVEADGRAAVQVTAPRPG
jgi:hypothetical protein